MDTKIKISMSKDGKEVYKLEDDNIEVQIILKKDYADVELKLANMNILKDIEDALGTPSKINEFEELVDENGFLYDHKKDMD